MPLNQLQEQLSAKLGKVVSTETVAEKIINEDLTMKNIGYLFYHQYYRGFDYNVSDEDAEIFFDTKNNEILDFEYHSQIYAFLQIDDNLNIKLKTRYPGLASGLGIGHGVKAVGEFKLGFFFDYTSGLPVIPGSSVKGTLRSLFPNREKHKDISDEDRELRYNFIKYLLGKVLGDKDTYSNEIIDKLENELFEGVINGQPISIYQRDTFYDAIIYQGNSFDKILGKDSITPHGTNPLRNPTPLLFLKILPEVIIQFNFEIHDSIVIPTLTKEKKLTLFQQILLDLGIGAKTNVGYGRFADPKISK